MELQHDINRCKSYRVEDNLNKVLAKFPPEWRYLRVWTKDGSVTAVFIASSLGGNVIGPAQAGFMVVG